MQYSGENEKRSNPQIYSAEEPKQQQKRKQDRKDYQARKGRPKNQQTDADLKERLEKLNVLQKFIVENYQNQQDSNIFQVEENLNSLILKIDNYQVEYDALDFVNPGDQRKTFQQNIREILDEFLQYELNYLDPKYDPLIEDENDKDNKKYPYLQSTYFFDKYIRKNQEMGSPKSYLTIEQFMAVSMMELILKVTSENFERFFKFFDIVIQLTKQQIVEKQEEENQNEQWYQNLKQNGMKYQEQAIEIKNIKDNADELYKENKDEDSQDVFGWFIDIFFKYVDVNKERCGIEFAIII